MFSEAESHQFFEYVLFHSLGQSLKVNFFQFLGGGALHNSVKLLTPAGSFFLKWHETGPPDLLPVEARGLKLLRTAEAVSVPEVLGVGRYEGKHYLLLEYFDERPPSPDYWEAFGQRLAEQHVRSRPQHGLEFDNYLGALPQANGPLADGVAFWVERRLRAQAGLALYHEVMPRPLYERLERLYPRLPDLIPNERAALLHGDLSEGNILTGRDGYAALVDPAPYYGYREAELAYAQLLGRCEAAFFEAYTAAFPLEPGFAERADLFKLYPLLVHANLLSSNYLRAVERILDKYE